MRATALNCTLKHGPASSSTDELLDLVAKELSTFEVELERYRVVDHSVAFGVTSDEGGEDGWPALRAAVLGADILVLATPIWMGHPSSVAQMVLERLDAFLGETDDQGRIVSSGQVAVVGVVGNEDGAHLVGSQLFKGLNDVGFTIPSQGMTYWVGEAMQTVDFKDLDQVPDSVSQSTRTMVANAVHLAKLLATEGYPEP
jgi:multimeric flavodoxin WrbA